MVKYDLKSLNTLPTCKGLKFSNIPYNSDRQTLIDHIMIEESYVQNVTDCQIFDVTTYRLSFVPIIYMQCQKLIQIVLMI